MAQKHRRTETKRQGDETHSAWPVLSFMIFESAAFVENALVVLSHAQRMYLLTNHGLGHSTSFAVASFLCPDLWS